MKTFSKVAVAAIIGLGLLSTTVHADASKGQKIYAKKLKSVCDKSGAVFAASHTQMEWEMANSSGELGATFKAECPAGSDLFDSAKFQKKMQSHLYDFVMEYASDSGNVPSC